MSLETINQMTNSANDPSKAEKPAKTQAELRADLAERAELLRISTLKQIDIYDERLADGDFDDREDEPVGSGEKRKLQAQKELLKADARLDKMTEILASNAELPPEAILDPEALKTEYQPLLESVFGKPPSEFIPTFIKPVDQNYFDLSKDPDPLKFGEYTLNPDTQNLDFENILESKILIPDLSTFVGQPRSKVLKHLADTYSGTHHLPGLEYWKWLIENPAKTPSVLKDTKVWFYFPGSLIRDSGGHWYVPSANWRGSAWNRNAHWLGNSWTAVYRVVLLEI